MNNNKKYKKWSLGLVAPALVLAPIAVVASCSSSGEEKPAYGVTFTNNNEIKATIHKAVQPADLTDVQFKEEVLEHKSDLFTIEGTLPSDSFLNDNIEISELNPSADAKTVSAKVKLNNANTNGEPIEKTITLKGLGYVEVDLNGKTYTIAFKVNDQNPQEIELADQSTNSVESLTAEQLMKLVIGKKDEILTITDDQKIITDDVLENQILKIIDIQPNKAEGKVTFKLSVEKPKDGAGTTLEKNIVFAGFKKETDSTPPAETDKFKIKFKDVSEFVLENLSDQSVSSITNGDDLKPIVIKNKDKIFEAETGALPADEWWTEKLTISKPTLDAANGAVTANISLDGYNTTETADQINTVLTKEQVVLKGFREEAKTVARTEEISTVTLGLNGTVGEITGTNEVDANWVLNNKRLLFTKGFNLIKEASDIKDVTLTGDSAQQNKKATLSFKIVANKWFSADGQLGTAEQAFTINIKGFPGQATNNQLLAYKSGTGALSIGLVDPILAEGTYEQFKDKSAEIFTKDFVFKYRKHLLTGDFSKIDTGTADDFLVNYGNSSFVKVAPDDSGKTIQITFKIQGAKLVNSPSDADKEYSITFNGFKASSN